MKTKRNSSEDVLAFAANGQKRCLFRRESASAESAAVPTLCSFYQLPPVKAKIYLLAPRVLPSLCWDGFCLCLQFEIFPFAAFFSFFPATFPASFISIGDALL